jgi:uncharacterized protein YbjT (DUF2867 family)
LDFCITRCSNSVSSFDILICLGAYGDAATSTIHERDVAAVAARALVNPAHAGHSYVLTGPQSLTQRDKVCLIGEAIGKELSFEECRCVRPHRAADRRRR